MVLRIAALSVLTLCAALAYAGPEEADVDLQPDGKATDSENTRRFALIIAVQHYDEFEEVQNALDDGEGISRALLASGYEFVRLLTDPSTKYSILDGLDELLQRAQPTVRPVVLTVFFAGHGFRKDDANFLVPAKAQSISLVDDSVAMPTLIRRMKSEFGYSIVFFDACRTHASNNNSQDGLIPGLLPGFSGPPEYESTVISLSTSAGHTATSVDRYHSDNSPYAWALRTFIPVTGISLGEVLTDVGDHVKDATNDQPQPQQPVVVTTASTSFYFQPSTSQLALEDEAWRSVARHPTIRCLTKFMSNHPGSRYIHRAIELLQTEDIEQGGERCLQ